VQLVIQSGRPVAQVARELGINEGTLGNWVNLWKQDNPEQEKPLTVVDRARLRHIEEEKANYPITLMCALLGLARSSYYAWTKRVELSATAARRAELTELVVELFDHYEQRYGCRRIAWMLNGERGVPVSVGTVAVADYIEMFYNRKRHHSTLGYRTPARALADYHQTATAA
jgi:transposase-like protein